MYHSIQDNTDSSAYTSCLSLIGMAVPRSKFLQQIAYISKNYSIIGLDDLVDSFLSNRHLPKNPLVITFDDGFNDNYITAVPILEQYRIRATFFIIGNSLENSGGVCHHLLYRMLDRLTGGPFRFEVAGISCEAIDESLKPIIMRKLRKVLEDVPYEKKMALLQEMCWENGIDASDLLKDSIYMSGAEIRQIRDAGHLIGAHSMTHENLARLSGPAKEDEIIRSRAQVTRLCGQPFVPFAYPYGTAGSYDSETSRLLRTHGFGCAVTTIEGSNSRDCDLYEMKRIEVGNYGQIEFMVRVTGIIGDLKTLVKQLTGKNTAK